MKRKQAVAAGLIRAVEDAEQESQALGARLPVQREAVRRYREDLLQLARRLQSDDDANLIAVQLASELLADVDSPLYDASGDRRSAVRRALTELEGHSSHDAQ